MENLNQTIPVQIESIPLNDTNYGRSLNERFDSINANFESIISRDYLKGNDGANVGVEPWQIDINTNDDTEKSYIEDIIDAICSLDIDSNSTKSEQSLGIKNQLNGKTIYLVKDSTGQLLSSLPFTYIDYRYASSSSVRDKDLKAAFENTRDLSCVICYDNGFKAVQSFPTIYWDSSLTTGDNEGGDLCWMINGEKTGLPCRGLQGANGLSGRLYTAFYDVNQIKDQGDGIKVFPIVAVLSTNYIDNQYKNEYILADNFVQKNVDLNTGDTVIGIPCELKKKDENGQEKYYIEVTCDNSTAGHTSVESKQSKYTISTVYVDAGTSDVWASHLLISDSQSVEIPLILEKALLSDILKNIGLPGTLQSLYVPADRRETDGAILTGHAMWNDPTDNTNMCLGTINTPAAIDNNTPTALRGKKVTVKSDELRVGVDDHAKTIIGFDDDKSLNVKQTAFTKKSQSITVPNFNIIELGGSSLIDNPIYGEASSVYQFSNCGFNGQYMFGRYQTVYINGAKLYVTAITEQYTSDQYYILWNDFNHFYQCIYNILELVKEGRPGDLREETVTIVQLENLHVDPNDGVWKANSFTKIHTRDTTTITFRYDEWHGQTSFILYQVLDIDLVDNCFGYHLESEDGRLVSMKSDVLFDIDDAELPAPLPIKLSQSEVLYIVTSQGAKLIELDNIEVNEDFDPSNVFATNDILPIPDKRVRKYLNSGYHTKLTQEFDAYEGKFGKSYVIESPEVEILGDESTVRSTTHMIASENCIIDGSSYVNTSDTIVNKSHTLGEYAGEIRRGHKDAWLERSGANVCSFEAKSVVMNFDLTATLNTTNFTTYARLLIPIVDTGFSSPEYRFRSIFKTEVTIYDDKIEHWYNHLLLCTDDIQKLYSFFDGFMNGEFDKGISTRELYSKYQISCILATDIEVDVNDTNKNFYLNLDNTNKLKVSTNQFSGEPVTMHRDYNRAYKDVYAWRRTSHLDLTNIAAQDAEVLSILAPFEKTKYILTQSFGTTSVNRAPDGHSYQLLQVTNPNYEYSYLNEEYDIDSNASLTQNSYYLGTGKEGALHNLHFREHIKPILNVYGNDVREEVCIDKIYYFCSQFNINGEDLISKIKNLEDRIAALEK